MTRAYLVVLSLAALPCLASAQPAPQPAQASAPAPWYERLRISGDFRARYEGFYQEDVETRNRARIRLRLRLDAAVNDDVQFQLRVASGDPGTPVSTNQTLTGFFQPKPLSLDRAFIAYNPEAASALTAGAGKFNAPQTVTQMVFDEDLNFEGGWEEVAWEPSDDWEVTLLGLQTVVDEHSADADSYMLGAYGAVMMPFGAHRLHVSAANYAWTRADGIAAASAEGSLDSALTNALVRDATGRVIGFASGFNVVDLIAEATLQTGRRPYPVRLLANVARNTRAATGRDSGVWLEVEYGQAGQPGTWRAGYTYASIEQDVSPSAFVFSDIPGTNTRLHAAELSYLALTALSLDATLHLTRRLVAPAGDPNTWLSRLHLAAVVRF